MKTMLVLLTMVSIAVLGAARPAPANVLTISDSAEVFGAQARTWFSLNEYHHVQTVALEVPMQSIENAPLSALQFDAPPCTLRLADAVKAQTGLDHIEIHWNAGDRNATRISSAARFEFQFYFAALRHHATARRAGSAAVPAPKKAAGAARGAKTLSAPGVQTGPLALQPIMVRGYYKKECVGVKPMISRDWFLKKKSFAITVPRLPAYGMARMMPFTFRAVYNPVSKSYFLVWSDFSYK